MAGAPEKYQYDPSLAAAALFAALFGISTAGHLFQLIQTRTWYFIAFFLGSLFEVVGYAARAVNASENPDYSTVPFIIQTLLPLLGPALFAASIYMILGRIIRVLDGEHLSLISTKWLTKIFVFGDIFSFAIQCIGGGVLAGADSKSALDRGQNIILVGLAIQIIFFGCFIAVISVFHYRVLKNPTRTSVTTHLPWGQFIYVLYFTSLLIMVRSIFRVAEFAGGEGSALQTSEAYLYCLDTVLMFSCCVAFNVWHPSRVVSAHGQKGYGDVELGSSAT
ncbi:RTA1 like protein-domain-containing protein [Ilyonectria robusta]|uniref:RTA1 like protein-domain-containing protein n=1 Tax=Ilyonectria robusta TaxID=1079257 RepID=UPI001E8D9AAE|nr:RTA1 like protein-domain-containing protein [Ilyonectria robusta]KAH8683671.1 RTA1 like protein-domain-containing protein [Ilyonectria robusta]